MLLYIYIIFICICVNVNNFLNHKTIKKQKRIPVILKTIKILAFIAFQIKFILIKA